MDYDTSLPLYSWYFYKLKEKEKDIEMRNNQRGVTEGDIIRFMNGYNPNNGAIYRKVSKIVEKNTDEITDREIQRLALDNRLQLENYADGDEVYLFYLKEAKKK